MLNKKNNQITDFNNQIFSVYFYNFIQIEKSSGYGLFLTHF